MVSIYLPTGRTHEEALATRIRFKSLLRDARSKLVASGMADEEADRFLREASEQISSDVFWEHQEGGLAVFADGESTEFLKIAALVPERVFVANNYRLKALMAVAANVDAYYLLLVAQGRTQLFRGSRLGFRAVDCPGLPASYADWAEAEGFPEESRAMMAAESHLKADKHNLARYFSQIDEAVCKRLGDSHDPLILACVGAYVPIYRKANRYLYLAEAFLEGNFERARSIELHDRALHDLHHEFIESRKRALLRFKEMGSDPRVVSDVHELVPAVIRGQVAVVCVPSDTELWGCYDDGSASVTLVDDPAADAVDLYELLARQALAHGAEVFFVEEAKMPVGHKVLGLLRWADR